MIKNKQGLVTHIDILFDEFIESVEVEPKNSEGVTAKIKDVAVSEILHQLTINLGVRELSALAEDLNEFIKNQE